MVKRKRKIQMDEGLRLVIEVAGSRYRLSKLLGLTPASTQRWTRVPIRRVLEVEKLTGVPREKLRPDFFRVPHHGKG